MIKIRREDETIRVPEELALLPLRDVVVFPYMIIPLLVGRPKSVAALTAAVDKDRLLVVAAQRRAEIAEPKRKDLHSVGTVVRVLQLLRLPDNTIKVLVEGLGRVELGEYVKTQPHVTVGISGYGKASRAGSELSALVRSVEGQFEEYVKLHKKIPEEILISIGNVTDRDHLVEMIGAHLSVSLATKQSVLDKGTTKARFQELSRILSNELEILRIEKKIEGEVRSQVQKNQKEFYLNEQLKAIRKELGAGTEGGSEVGELAEAVAESNMPDLVADKALKEIEKLGKMPPLSPEATVARNYIDWLLNVPWGVESDDTGDLNDVMRILDEDHFGLEKVKQRIVEYVAVIQLARKIRGPILCFVGPPGVGKTSLGKSIARALGREFIRVSLGGVRDEAEIRGHRRTYIGALPGRIIQSLKKAGTMNPVFLLDEVDKMSKDFHGDPASALLEVLDPEQNHTFSDHYLEVECDLSRVMFLTTANTLHGIPPPLLDRMELIRLPGYLEPEKVEIAKGFLVPHQVEEHGLSKRDITVTNEALRSIIRGYTREAGVRNLEREIARVCRKVARKVVGSKKRKKISVNGRNLDDFLGVPRFSTKRVDKKNWIGVATGLAWTSTGGETLHIEVSTIPGKGNLILTGTLGDVMRESARAALTYIRSRAEALGLDKNFYETIDLHVHIPEGAIPKDGPSAGISIAAALISSLTGIALRRDTALTGEITLRGHVLPIGGLNEKLVAALRAGVRTVILPKENEKDLVEIPEEAKKGLTIYTVERMDQVLPLVMVEQAKKSIPLLARGGARSQATGYYTH